MSGIASAYDRFASATVTVHVVDDNPDVRDSESRLIRASGLAVNEHAGGIEFLKDYDPQVAGCVVLDIAMPEMNGLQVQEVLNDFAVPPPVIFVTGNAEVPFAVRALRAGAIDFLEKPFRAEALLERVCEAIDRDLENRRRYAVSEGISERLERLTPRERQVAILLATGQCPKQIAHVLGIRSKTVENHRAKVLEKLQVDNPTQLANLIAQLPEFAHE